MTDPLSTSRAYLALADEHAPGLVEAFYLQGSVALDDYRPGVSDIDFVAVTAREPAAGELRTVHEALRRSHGETFFDGLYVTAADLRRDPEQCPPGLAVHEWRVLEGSRFERNLVTWHVLAQGGVPVRGPRPEVHTDWPALAERTRQNLAGYWTGWRVRAAFTPGAWTTSWGVLGMARLRHTLAERRVTSKTEAAAFALDAYDQRFHRIVREALRLRVGGEPQYRSPVHRHLDLLKFTAMVLAEP
ncbi:aminoglycoside adenylyltransferase domain-containing protein [Actinoplanes sp. NPDC023714]|uniref:aminoglycoside adenylyltransferase domain-containing protein n=1 Tax=Actinoplanes sp. NPDC023714 TaxID=3154322 RepID=UPI0033C6383F